MVFKPGDIAKLTEHPALLVEKDRSREHEMSMQHAYQVESLLGKILYFFNNKDYDFSQDLKQRFIEELKYLPVRAREHSEDSVVQENYFIDELNRIETSLYLLLIQVYEDHIRGNDEDGDEDSSQDSDAEEELAPLVDILDMNLEEREQLTLKDIPVDLIPLEDEDRLIMEYMDDLASLKPHLKDAGISDVLDEVNELLNNLQNIDTEKYDVSVSEDTHDLHIVHKLNNDRVDIYTQLSRKAVAEVYGRGAQAILEARFSTFLDNLDDVEKMAEALEGDALTQFVDKLNREATQVRSRIEGKVANKQTFKNEMLSIKQMEIQVSDALDTYVLALLKGDLKELVTSDKLKTIEEDLYNEAAQYGTNDADVAVQLARLYGSEVQRRRVHKLHSNVDKSLEFFNAPQLRTDKEKYLRLADTAVRDILGPEHSFGSIPEHMGDREAEALNKKFKELYDEINKQRFAYASLNEAAQDINARVERARSVRHEKVRADLIAQLESAFGFYIRGLDLTSEAGVKTTITYKDLYIYGDETAIQERVDGIATLLEAFDAVVAEKLAEVEDDKRPATLADVTAAYGANTMTEADVLEELRRQNLPLRSIDNVDMQRALLGQDVSDFIAEVWLITENKAKTAEYEQIILTRVNEMRGLAGTSEALALSELFGERGIEAMSKRELGMLEDLILVLRTEFRENYVSKDVLQERLKGMLDDFEYRLKPLAENDLTAHVELTDTVYFIEHDLPTMLDAAESVEDYNKILLALELQIEELQRTLNSDRRVERRRRLTDEYELRQQHVRQLEERHAQGEAFLRDKAEELEALQSELDSLTTKSGKFFGAAKREQRIADIEELIEKLIEDAERVNSEMIGIEDELSDARHLFEEAVGVAIDNGLVRDDGTLRESSVAGVARPVHESFTDYSVEATLDAIEAERANLAVLYLELAEASTRAERLELAEALRLHEELYLAEFEEAARSLKGAELENLLKQKQQDYARTQRELAKYEMSGRGFFHGAIMRLADKKNENMHEILSKRARLEQKEYSILKSQFTLEHAHRRLDKLIDAEETFYMNLLEQKREFADKDRNVIERTGNRLYELWNSLGELNLSKLMPNLDKSSKKYKFAEQISVRNAIFASMGLFGGGAAMFGKGLVAKVISGAFTGLGTYSILTDRARWKVYDKISDSKLKSMTNNQLMAELNKRASIAVVHNMNPNEVSAVKHILAELYSSNRLLGRNMVKDILADRYISPEEMVLVRSKIDEFSQGAIDDFEKKLAKEKNADTRRKVIGIITGGLAGTGIFKSAMSSLFNDSAIGKFFSGLFDTETASQAVQQGNKGITSVLPNVTK